MARRKGSLLPKTRAQKVVFWVVFDLLALVVILVSLETAARVYLYLTRASSTIGLPQRNLQLDYRAFVMFGRDWSRELAPENLPAQPGAGVRVLLLGGSTANSFPGDVLEASLRRRFPERRFQVIKATENMYNARQEVIVAGIWGLSLDPDIILTLDGANDFIFRLRMPDAETFSLDGSYEATLKRPYLAPIHHVLRHSQLLHGLERWRERRTVEEAATYSDAVPVYVSAQHSLNVMARGCSAHRIMVLQPYRTFKNPLSPAEQGFRHYAYRDGVVAEMFEAAHQALLEIARRDGGVTYIDGRYAFEGVSRTVFADDVHIVDREGYRLLADAIARSLDESALPLD